MFSNDAVNYYEWFPNFVSIRLNKKLILSINDFGVALFRLFYRSILLDIYSRLKFSSQIIFIARKFHVRNIFALRYSYVTPRAYNISGMYAPIVHTTHRNSIRIAQYKPFSLFMKFEINAPRAGTLLSRLFYYYNIPVVHISVQYNTNIIFILTSRTTNTTDLYNSVIFYSIINRSAVYAVCSATTRILCSFLSLKKNSPNSRFRT